MPGLLIGTLPYMSPERIRGGAPVESWDIWALAVMAFEMLTGVHPFSALRTWGSTVVEDRFPSIEENAAPALTLPLKQFFSNDPWPLISHNVPPLRGALLLSSGQHVLSNSQRLD